MIANFLLLDPQRLYGQLLRRLITVATPLFIGTLNFCCRDKVNAISAQYKFITPTYGIVQLKVTNDTVDFPLSERMYNDIKSFNTFVHNGDEFISFFDRRSQT